MRITWGLALSALIQTAAAAEPSNCPAGAGTFADSPCIPAKMVSFLYCVQRLGNGRVEIATRSEKLHQSVMDVSVNGGGAGLVLKLEGGVAYKKSDADHAIDEAVEKLDPRLSTFCKELAQTSDSVERLGRGAFDRPDTPRYRGRMGPLERGLSYNQGDIYDTPSATPAECSKRCDDDNRCIAVTWIESQKRCWVKGSFTGNIGYSSDMVSARRLITR